MSKQSASSSAKENGIFISRTLTSQQAWKSIVHTLHKSDLALFKCDGDRYFGLAIKESRHVTILIWGQNNFMPLLEGTKGLVAKAFCIQKTYKRNLTENNIPRHKLIGPPVPTEEATFTAKTSNFVRTVLKLISKLPFLKKYLKDILLAFKDAEKVSKWSRDSKLIDQHTQFEWALERLKNSTIRISGQLEHLNVVYKKLRSTKFLPTFDKFHEFLSSKNITVDGKQLFKATSQLQNVNPNYDLLFTNIIKTFETYSKYLSKSATSWRNLINSVMNSKDNNDNNSSSSGGSDENKNDTSSTAIDNNNDDDEAAVTDEDMTLKTIDCIAGVPWNAVCRRTMAVFVKYLTDNYNDELVNEQGFDDEMLMSVEEIPNDHSPAIMVNESNHRFNSILTDRCKWKHDKFMKNARKVCKKNIKYLLDEANRGDAKVYSNGKKRTRNPGENTKYGIAPFHNQALPVLLVQVVEALAKDAETLEAELNAFIMMVSDAVEYKSEENNITTRGSSNNNKTNYSVHEIVPFKIIECFKKRVWPNSAAAADNDDDDDDNSPENVYYKDMYEEYERYRQLPGEKIDFYSHLMEHIVYSRPIEFFFNQIPNEVLSSDFKMILKRLGISDILHLNDLKYEDFEYIDYWKFAVDMPEEEEEDEELDELIIKTKEEAQYKKIFRSYYMTLFRLSGTLCRQDMKQILPLYELIRQEVIDNLIEIEQIWTSKFESTDMLPDDFLVNMFLLLQAEYTYLHDDRDLMHCAKVGGRWFKIINEMVHSTTFPPEIGKPLLNTMPTDFPTLDLSMSRNFDQEELDEDDDIYEDTRYVILKNYRLKKQKEAKSKVGEEKKGYNQGRADFVNAIHNINNGSLYKGRGTALHAAATNGNAEVVEALLEYDADPNIPDGYGRTALHCSARNGHVATVVSLLNGGANVKAKDKNGHTPLQLAKKHCKDNVELLKILKDAVKKGNAIRSQKGMARTARQLNDAINLLQSKTKSSGSSSSSKSSGRKSKK